MGGMMDATFRRGLANPMERSLAASSTLMDSANAAADGYFPIPGAGKNVEHAAPASAMGGPGGTGAGEFGPLAQQQAAWRRRQAAQAAMDEAAAMRGGAPADGGGGGYGFEEHPALAAAAARAMAAQDGLKMGNLEGSLEEVSRR